MGSASAGWIEDKGQTPAATATVDATAGSHSGALLDDARRNLAFWRYDCAAVGPHSSFRAMTSLELRRILEQFDGYAPRALAPIAGSD